MQQTLDELDAIGTQIRQLQEQLSTITERMQGPPRWAIRAQLNFARKSLLVAESYVTEAMEVGGRLPIIVVTTYGPHQFVSDVESSDDTNSGEL